jgi:N-acetylmuramoyl-L-alanine amidase
VYLVILVGCFLLSTAGNKAVIVLSENAPFESRRVVIIDAGHGGVDGGATSCTGVLESKFNLEIALKLNDLMHLLGIDTVMIRDTDCSVYTKGETIAQKKVSDLKERVRITNSIENALLISIHQNQFFIV